MTDLRKDQMLKKSRQFAVMVFVDVFIAAKLSLRRVGGAGRVRCSNPSGTGTADLPSLLSIFFVCASGFLFLMRNPLSVSIVWPSFRL